MKLLSDLVKIQSISGNEKNLAAFLMTYLSSLNLQPFLLDGNVIAHLKGKNNDHAIIFNAHMDTVSPGDLSAWKYPATGQKSGILIGNNVYGLGASDDKAGIASLLLLAELLIKKQPEIDVWFTFVVKEEIDGSGTKSFIKWFKEQGWIKKYKKISAVICEPTDLKEIKIGHRRSIFVKITINGDGGHGSKPHLVKNDVITTAYKIIKKLKMLGSLWGKEYEHPLLGQPTIAVTTISAGDSSSPNKFADSCTLTLDIRATPNLYNNVFSLLNNELKEFKVSIDILNKLSVFSDIDPNSEIILKIKQLTNAKITIGIGSSDLYSFIEANIPGIIFGPGTYKTIHKANEYCEIKKVQEAVNIYQQLISL